MPEVEAGAVPNRGWYLLAVSWPLFSVCAIITALRFWVRIRIVRSCGWDDAFILLALICATINTVLITISVQHGTGCHTDTLSLKQQIASMKYQVLSQGFHVMSTNWGKVSVALFLIRIIGEVKNHKRGLIALIVIMSVINVGGVGTIYGQCSPPDMIWDHRVPGSCWPPGAHKNSLCSYRPHLGDIPAFHDKESANGSKSQSWPWGCPLAWYRVCLPLPPSSHPESEIN
ncbi:uncharacterized protein BDV17DRAFT_15948 [Aspergillus undulatus]|uniref:uncharacterized protein n=1 Tax=Aspergillus undulatus TaxID=1810928 RepID=UPI003CCE39C4